MNTQHTPIEGHDAIDHELMRIMATARPLRQTARERHDFLAYVGMNDEPYEPAYRMGGL